MSHTEDHSTPLLLVMQSQMQAYTKTKPQGTEKITATNEHHQGSTTILTVRTETAQSQYDAPNYGSIERK